MSGVPLAVHDLVVDFGGVSALAGVSFEVQAGTITSLIGPNGAGKTTAFNAITGYLRPGHGRVLVENVSIVGRRPAEIAQLGVVRTFQKTSVFPTLSVRANVLTGLHLHGRVGVLRALLRPPSVRAEEMDLGREADRVLRFVGLGARGDAIASGLPHGEQRLVELAIALGARPRVLLLDEPAAGMAGAERDRLVTLIRAIRDTGVTILLVEHDMRVVMGISDRVVVLNHGRVIAAGTPDVVRAHPDVVRAYLGATHAQA